MSAMSCAIESSARSTLDMVRPERSTVTRSEIACTSSMRWEMKRMPTPAAVRRRISANSRSRVRTSRAAVDSSRIRMRGSRTSARTMQTACRSESDSCPAAESRSMPSTSRPRVSAAIWRCFDLLSFRAKSPSEPSQMLSSTDWLAAVSTSWKTTAMPSVFMWRGPRCSTTAASSVNSPSSGRCTPPMILTSVDLPEPFSPRSVWTSPGWMCRYASTSARVAPKRLLTLASRRPSPGSDIPSLLIESCADVRL